MYFSVTTTYYQHMPITSIVDIGELLELEVELLERDYKNIIDAVENVCGGFFMANLTRDRSWPLELG